MLLSKLNSVGAIFISWPEAADLIRRIARREELTREGERFTSFPRLLPGGFPVSLATTTLDNPLLPKPICIYLCLVPTISPYSNQSLRPLPPFPVPVSSPRNSPAAPHSLVPLSADPVKLADYIIQKRRYGPEEVEWKLCDFLSAKVFQNPSTFNPFGDFQVLITRYRRGLLKWDLIEFLYV